MLFCRANFATSLIFLMESSSSRFSSAMPLRGVDAIGAASAVSRRPASTRFAAPRRAGAAVCMSRGVIGAGPSVAGRPAVLRLWALVCYQFKAGRTTSFVRLQVLPLRNEDLRVVTHTRSLLQTAPRTGHLPKKELLAEAP